MAHLKRTLLFVCASMLVVANAKAQSSQAESSSWNTYTVKDVSFSVTLPKIPSLYISKEVRPGDNKDRKRYVLEASAEAVVYTIFVVENPKPRQALEEFIKEQTTSNPKWQLTPERNLTLNGFAGKAFVSTDQKGMVQFFATENRFYDFRAYGAPLDDVRMIKFFSSLSLTNRRDGFEVSEGAGETLARVYKGSEVDRKVQLKKKPDPSYTESARRYQITGTVILKCIFTAQGTVTNCVVIEGLPYGLTERAVESATKIKFVPAMKDGLYVSVWMQLVYNFELF